MQVIRRGATRTVILTRCWAVKVPSGRGMAPFGKTWRGRLSSFARGVLANQSEYIWSGFAPWQGQVAPVRRSWLGGIVQVYPRCEPLPDGYRLPALEPCPGDRKASNYGLYQGRVVRVDYDMTGN